MPRFGFMGITQSFSDRPFTPGPTCGAQWGGVGGRAWVPRTTPTRRHKSGGAFSLIFPAAPAHHSTTGTECSASAVTARAPAAAAAPGWQRAPHLDHHRHAVVPRHKGRLHVLCPVQPPRLHAVPAAQTRELGAGSWELGVGSAQRTRNAVGRKHGQPASHSQPATHSQRVLPQLFRTPPAHPTKPLLTPPPPPAPPHPTPAHRSAGLMGVARMLSSTSPHSRACGMASLPTDSTSLGAPASLHRT